MKWYEYSQNNSGGSFDVDDDVCHRLFIEAERPEFANIIAQDKGVYFGGGGDCPCCGDRWSPADSWDEVKLDGITIEEHAQQVADDWGWTSPDCYIYYADGRKEAIYSKKVINNKGASSA